MNDQHYLNGARIVFDELGSDSSYLWSDFEKWCVKIVSENDAFSLLGSQFMRLHCPPIIDHIMKEPSLHAAYKSNHGSALTSLSKYLCEGVSLSEVDSGYRTKTGKKSRWTAKSVGELYVESLYESWGINALHKSFELCATMLITQNLPKKTNRDYIELAVALLLARDFDQYLSQ